MTTRTPAATYPDLSGKVTLVTGGSGGLGSGAARLFAENGARIVVNGRNQEKVDRVVESLRHDGAEAIGVAADCTDAAALERMRDRVESELGPVDILIAFAGGQGEPVPARDLNEERWRGTIDANLTSTYLTVRAFLPGMLDRGGGAIVTMASTSGRLPSRASIAYGAAKAGIIMYTRHLANEVAPQGVRANCIAPGSVLTDINRHLMPPDVQRQVAQMHPLGRLGTPEDVGEAALFLASDSSSWITGVTLDVSGGRVMI